MIACSGDVILTYSDSSLIEKLLLEAAKEKKFKVIVSDGRAQFSGKS
jgi:translation initiation factor 2B subunit (eIF-2B alpha/beta/delta family)